MHHSYLGLGSNLSNPASQVNKAIEKISELNNTDIVLQSSIYQTIPLLPPERPHEIQDNYFNAVVKITTALTPHELLKATQTIESNMGRVRTKQRWQARVIDIDLLLYDNIDLESPELILPHPEMYHRLFVIEPLFEIEPNLVLPNRVPIRKLLEELEKS